MNKLKSFVAGIFIYVLIAAMAFTVFSARGSTDVLPIAHSAEA